MIEEPRNMENHRLVRDDYSIDDLKNDINILIRLGLIEVGGITPDGDWLYQKSAKAESMTTEELIELILKDDGY